MDFRYEYYDEIDSTNDLAKKRGAEGADEGLVIVSDHQTGGRGRMGRSFFSPKGTGLYMSIILRPVDFFDGAATLTVMAASAVALAIEEISGKKTLIKWVNDIIIDGKKVCGILAESVIGSDNFIVLGIGVNVFQPIGGFPDEINQIAGGVFLPGEKEVSKEMTTLLAEKILSIFMEYYENGKDYMTEYRNRNFVLGGMVDIYSGGEFVRQGKVVDMDKRGRICIENAKGERDWLFYGEISIRPGEIK